LLFVLFYVLFMCKCVLPPGDNPIAVNKYQISFFFCDCQLEVLKMTVTGQFMLCLTL